MKPTKWDDALFGSMSLEAIRRLYKPETYYRVSWNRYSPNEEFCGWSQVRCLYVLKGRCTIRLVEGSWNVCGGEFLELPKGNYHFSASEDSPVEIVEVWEIPEALRENPDKIL